MSDFVLRDSEFPPLDTTSGGPSLHTPTDEDSHTTLMGKSVLNKMSGNYPKCYTDKLVELFATYEYACSQNPELWTVLIRTPPPLAFVSFGGDYAMLARDTREQQDVLTKLEALTNSVMTLFVKKLPRTPEQRDAFRRIDCSLGNFFDAMLKKVSEMQAQ
jgi:hypothetical protein